MFCMKIYAVMLTNSCIFQIAISGMDNRLLRYGAKEYYFRAAMCRMCRDVQDTDNAVRRYEDMFPAFGDSRECNFLKVCFTVTKLKVKCVCPLGNAHFLLSSL